MAAPPPPPAPRRRCSGGCLCCLVIVIVVILLAAATILIWLLSPGFVRATAVSATLSRFDLEDGHSGGGGGGTLQYNLTVDILMRNINGYRLNYDYAEAQASYDGERFGYDPVEPFYQEGKSERTLTTAFAGSSPVDGGDAVPTYRRERSDGFYFLKVGLYSDLSLKARMSYTRLKCKISCTLRLPVPNTSATPVTTQLGTTCDVDINF